MWAGIGSMVIGRHLFDTTNGWDGAPPAGDHVVVVSHRWSSAQASGTSGQSTLSICPKTRTR